MTKQRGAAISQSLFEPLSWHEVAPITMRRSSRPSSARAWDDDPGSLQRAEIPKANAKAAESSGDDSDDGMVPDLRVIDAGAVNSMIISPMRPPASARSESPEPEDEEFSYVPKQNAAPAELSPPERSKAAKPAAPPMGLPAPPAIGLPELPAPHPISLLAMPPAEGAKSGGDAAASSRDSLVSSAEPFPLLEPGWLQKKHAKKKMFGSQWGKRYFSISQRYGTLNYAKSESRSANIMLPLCDIKKVDRLPIEENGPYCFSVHCPPASLILKAENNEECSRWIQAITHHAELWKNKAAGALGSTSNSKSPPPTPPTTDPTRHGKRDFSTDLM